MVTTKTMIGIIVLAGSVLLSACAKEPDATDAGVLARSEAPPARVTVQTQATHSLIQQLTEQGIKVFQDGDNMRVIVPAALLFSGETQSLAARANTPLNAITALIQSLPKMSIQVAAYTHTEHSKTVDDALTQHQAWAVAHYLVRAGIDARLIYAVGGGHDRPVVQSPDSSSENDRIEISLRVLASEPQVNHIDY